MNASFSIEIGADEILHEFRLVSYSPATAAVPYKGRDGADFTLGSCEEVEFAAFKDGVEVDPDLTDNEIERIVEGLLRQTRE